mmetsp:Transcript_22627/g.67888  ORF Transcript_22627/g.67888 Transcript_22627/m.67888 type:complete len:230 (-) Transcript_22627:12-701(-)
MSNFLLAALLIAAEALQPAPRRHGSRNTRAHASSTESSTATRPSIAVYEEVKIDAGGYAPAQEVTVSDLTPHVRALIASSNLVDGAINIISQHTTTAITINEWESRLVRDIRAWILKLAPPDDRSVAGRQDGGVAYLHNDIHTRPDSEDERQRCFENGWNVDDPETLEAWRAQEPINAHSHLGAMLLGSSESIPVVDGQLCIGQWQSVMLVDLDGPRDRKVGLQALGFG